MNTYSISRGINTILNIRNFAGNPTPSDEFEIDGIVFKEVDQSLWLSIGAVEWVNFKKAFEGYYKKFVSLCNEITLMGQCYFEYSTQPILIDKVNKSWNHKNIIAYRHIMKKPWVGLSLMDKELKLITSNTERAYLNHTFLVYWNAMVNTTGFPARILVMFAAIDALFKTSWFERKPDFRKKVFGEDLASYLYKWEMAYRNRMVHGDYLFEDDKKNIETVIYEKMIEYINGVISWWKIKNIKNPPRHPSENYLWGWNVIEAKSPLNYDLLSNNFTYEALETDLYCTLYGDSLKDTFDSY